MSTAEAQRAQPRGIEQLAGNFTVILPLSPGEHVLDAAVNFGQAQGAFSATYHIHVG